MDPRLEALIAALRSSPGEQMHLPPQSPPVQYDPEAMRRVLMSVQKPEAGEPERPVEHTNHISPLTTEEQRSKYGFSGGGRDATDDVGPMLGYAVGGIPGSVGMEAAQRAGGPLGQGLGEYAGAALANLNPYGKQVAEPDASRVTEHIPQDLLKQAAMSAVLQKAQLAFHGSPHDFEKFSMEHMGTGEGHQAYGHGLYFAEKPETAAAYQEKLSAGIFPAVTDPNGKELSRAAALAAYFKPGNKIPGYAGTDEVVSFHPNDGNWTVRVRGTQPDPGSRVARERVHATTPTDKEIAQVLGPQGYEFTKGKTYAVDLPENENLLHYEKRLSEQPQPVREAIERERLTPPYTNDPRGDLIYESLANAYGKDTAAATLRDAGIPGMRYLDQGSRGSGEGTHNVVIWDDSKIKPIAKAPTMEQLLQDARVAVLRKK